MSASLTERDMPAAELRDVIHQLVDALPNDDLPTVTRMLKGLVADSSIASELAEEFAFWDAASNETWARFEAEIGEDDTKDAR